jgi:hypothetical protein
MMHMDASMATPDHPGDDLGGERPVVQRRLEARFPEVAPETVAQVIREAASVTADAKIKSYRPLLVEHRASDMIRVQLGG